MLTYTFSFNRNAAGQTATVKTVGGSTVDSGTVASTPDLGGAYNYQAELDEGTYIGTVTAGGYTSQAVGFLDIPDSIENSGGGVGAAETAYFVATGPTSSTDGSATALTFEADARHDALPDWASIADGDVVLSEDAGTVAYSLTGLADIDFSGTTPPDSDGHTSFAARPVIDGAGGSFRNADPAAGDGQDAQTTGIAKLGGVAAASTISIEVSPSAYTDEGELDNIPDGVATPRVALTITRIAQAAVLPDPA